MSTKQDRIASLLVRGMEPAMIARIVGCDPSYISQLLKDEAFQWHLQELSKEMEEEAVEGTKEHRQEEALFYTDRLAASEHEILDKILKELPYMAAREALVALDVVGKRRDAITTAIDRDKAKATFTMDGQGTVQTVEITIPTICIPELTFSGNREIIAIGNKSVNPMPTGQLKKMLEPREVPYEHHESLSAAL